VILQRTEQSQWLSNSYLVVDEIGGHGVLIDGNGAAEPLCERAEREGTDVTHVLVTHAHWDHVIEIAELAERLGARVLAHADAAAELGEVVDETLEDGDVVETGGLRIEALSTPGHAAGHLAYLIDGTDCITGDTLFRGTVAGTRAPGASGLEDLRRSIMERLLALPPSTRIHPGHSRPTTVAEEWERNPFVRLWRGLEEEGSEPCTVARPGQPEREEATLLLWGPDYDGTNKALVRFASGEEAIVGGSQVERGAG
jgi:glyoxylase-like metal-dependent hydrolase (beta-lactamase superfamily II)